MPLRVAVLGGGSWGTTVASTVSQNAPTTLWARNDDVVNSINERHENPVYLEGLKLSKSLSATSDLEGLVANCDVLIMGVPSKAMRDKLTEIKPFIRPWVPVISLAKGFEPGTSKRMTQIIGEVLPGHPPGVLTGPNLAKEIVRGYAAASVLAMEDESMLSRLRPLFNTLRFRVYTNPDMVGCELGGALKNVIAIAAGMGDGLGAGDNTRSMVITRGLAEITRIGVKLGGQAESFAGLTGLGDLLATCTSPLSRNYSVGRKLGNGQSIDSIVEEMNQVAEGINSSRIVYQMAQSIDVEAPITREVFRVCHENSNALDAFRGLLRVETGAESDPG